MKPTVPEKFVKKQSERIGKIIPLNAKIKGLMEKQNIQQKQLLKAGLKQSYLSRFLKGEIKKPTLQMCQKIAKALDMTVEELIIGTDCSDLLIQFGLTQRAFCPNSVCPKAYLNQWNGHLVEPQRYSTSRFDSLGNENKFCPFCGKPMIYKCNKCDKPIEDRTATYCSGCGERIFDPIKQKDKVQ